MSITQSFRSRAPSTLLFAALIAGAASAQSVRLKSRLFASGFDRPVLALSPPGDSSRLFVVEQRGVVRIVRDGAVLPVPFVDLDSIVGGESTGQESGLLGMAFHPDYAANRKFYVSYTNNYGGSVVREYRANAWNPDVADTSSFTIILPMVSHILNHNGGCLEFGPDRMLYLALGDGTQHQNSQSLNTYLGKLLRIDVENPPSFVPAGNPFAGSSRPLIWSYGWRNPWRFSFDRLTGDLYVADVGGSGWEEIDFQPASSTGGENYGWRCMEGNHCTGTNDCVCNAAALRRPIHEYSHSDGCSVIGGRVYRGNAIPGFRGHYLFADFCTNRIWSFRYGGGAVTGFVERTAELDPAGPDFFSSITSFGQDANGELYICTLVGRIYRIENDSACPPPVKYCVRTPNSAGPGGAVMGWMGSGSLAANDLVLKCWGCPPQTIGRFFYGQGRTQVPYGNGFRCVASGFIPLPMVQTNQHGIIHQPFDAHAPPGVITHGSVWDFQFWFRDLAGGGAAFDLSDGLEVTFCQN